MSRAISGALTVLLACAAAYGQPVEAPWEFDAASLKVAPPREAGEPRGRVGCFGGPGSRDPGRFTCARASVSLMALYAYSLKPEQLRPPVSTDATEFNLEAKVPPGATPEQVRAMLRALLAERLKLEFHRGKAEVDGYTLVVAKGGVKMKESAPEPASSAGTAAAPASPGPVKDADGFTYFARRDSLAVGDANGLTRWVGLHVPVDSVPNSVRLTGLLNSLTGRPIADSTGLTAKYDFTLTFSTESASGAAPAPLPEAGGVASIPDGGLTVFAAVERQLGLKLVPGKLAIDTFVIDRAAKTPVEN